MSKNLIPFSYYDVLDACAQPGCPFCRLAEETVNRYLDAILYENVNDPGTRDQLRASLGYCNEHAWRLPNNSGSALGIAILYQDLLTTVARNLEGARFEPVAGLLRRATEALDPERPSAATEAAVRALAPQAECPACAQRDGMEAIALGALLEALGRSDEPMQQALRASAGLCLVHLRRALELARDRASFEFLQQVAQDKLRGLLDELGEFIRKNDYRFSHEGFGAEGDSWRRAIAVIVGAAGVR